MGFSINTTVSDGVTKQYPVTFTNGIYDRDHVFVYVQGDVDGTGEQLERAFTWINDGLIELDVAAPAGKTVTIQRKMNRNTPDVDYADGAILNETNLDQGYDHLLNLIHEVFDDLSSNAGAVVRQYENQQGSAATGSTFTLNSLTYSLGTNDLTVEYNGQVLITGKDYIETGTNTVEMLVNFGPFDEFVFRSGIPAGAVSVESNTVGYLEFGADPTGTIDSTAAIQQAINYASTFQVELIGEAGTYKISSALMIPKQKGFRWSMERGCVLDASAATTAFNVIDAYSDRAVGVSTDYTEGLHINGGMIKPSAVAGSYGIALFYVLNACSIRNLEVRGGANSLLLTKEFYCTFENLKLKDADNIGLHIIGLSSDSGFNANPMTGLFITGAKNNVYLDDSDPSSVSNALVFNSCTFENSTETSVVINGSRPVTFLGCYWEGNYNTGAPAGGIVELAADDSLLHLSGCFMNTNLGSHDSTACSVGALPGSEKVRVVDNLTYKRRGVLSSFYQADLRIDFTSDAPNSDFSNGGIGFQKKEFSSGTGIARAHVLYDTSTMSRTVAPVGGNRRNCASSYIDDAPANRFKYPLFELDLTSAQNQTAWVCTVDLVSYEDPLVNPTRRGAATQFKISAFKDASFFQAYSNQVFERVRLSSIYGYFKIEHDGVSKVTGYFVPEHTFGNPTFNQSVEWQVRDFVCRNNGDVASINSLTDEAAVSGEPVRLVTKDYSILNNGKDLFANSINEIRDGLSYPLPLANSVPANTTLTVSILDLYKSFTPTVTASGSDTISYSGGTDTSIVFDSGTSLNLVLISDGVSDWRF